MTKKSVVVSPEAVVSMMLHAVKHVHEPVHGVLLGKFDDSGTTIKVTEAVPICHGAPTHPLLETALSLIESISDNSAVVVGWYVSPRLVKDDRPGPAALKIVSSLVGSDKNNEPALLVLCSDNLDKVLQGEDESIEKSLKALGKNFGKQWLDPLPIAFDDQTASVKAVKEAYCKGIVVLDLVDHFESDPKASKWYPNEHLKNFVKQCS